MLADAGVIDLTHLPGHLGKRSVERGAPLEPELKQQLEVVLARHHGNVSAAARELGKARMQVQRWLKRFAIDPASFSR